MPENVPDNSRQKEGESAENVSSRGSTDDSVVDDVAAESVLTV